MISNFRRIRTIAAASAMTVALAFAAPVTAFTALAATGTVTGSSINVRSEASTNGSIVGTVNTGDTVTVGETTTDTDGATWYQVTLSNGTTGYVRGDYITVSDDSGDGTATDDGSGTDVSADASSDTSADGSSDASSDAASDASTDSSDPAVTAATSAAEQDTGGYSIVLAPDGDTGEQTYYLYDNNNSVRMKISDIQKLPDEVTAAQQEAASVRTRYRVILIALSAVAAALLIGCIVLGLRLRDALANGRRERDLTMERRDQRRNNRNADSVEALRHGRGSSAPSRTGRGRDDAYASGARRYGRDEDAAGARRYGRDENAAGAGRRYGRDEDDPDGDIRGTRTSTTSPVYSERRPAGREDAYGRRSAQGGARESSLPARQSSARRGEEDDEDVRADRAVRGGTRATRAARSEDARSAGSGRDGDVRYSRTADSREGGAVRDAGAREGRQDAGRSAQGAPARNVRSAADAGDRRAARPAAGGQSRGQSASGNGASSGRGAAKNYPDDDFDYDFLQLDDGDNQ